MRMHAITELCIASDFPIRMHRNPSVIAVMNGSRAADAFLDALCALRDAHLCFGMRIGTFFSVLSSRSRPQIHGTRTAFIGRYNGARFWCDSVIKSTYTQSHGGLYRVAGRYERGSPKVVGISRTAPGDFSRDAPCPWPEVRVGC